MEIRSVTSFIAYYEGIHERTRRVVNLIPEHHLEWRPGQGRFSFGDVVRHLAAFERYVFAENVAGRESRYPGHGPELADGPEAVRAYFETRHTESLDIFRTLSDQDLEGRCTTPAGAPITKWKWLRAMVEHEVHHRGQIYLMLSLIGVSTPPVFGLTSEEVKARSAPAQ